MATLKDIAKRSGVSTATVSYVINNGPRDVLPETRARVLQAIQELNYHPNAFARGLKGKKGDVLGIVFPHEVAAPLENDYFSPVLAGLLDAATARRKISMLFTGMKWDEAERNVPVYSDGRCEGLVLIAPPRESRLVPLLLEKGTPIVVIGTRIPGATVTTVDSDNVEGARIGVQHLIDLGHRRIAMIKGPVNSSSGPERYAGYLQAHGDSGLEVDPELAVQGAYEDIVAYRASRDLLARPPKRRPTAIFCPQDSIAASAMRAAEDLGLRIPDDVSLVGFDDVARAKSLHPPLTTLRQQLREIGVCAATKLFEQIADPTHPPADVIFDVQFVRRASTAPPPKYG
ncbi:LacI family DNA-binding transcriptional regulator [Fimbriimonas ginsengisoli]|uniref:Transcriptional regulator, LacI family n=1 Tax=Fimbriimonas ginsengisoli Gsoil 348 TaxID=661478 RepID=A0A068NS60_FIMGI|nr:LacI family DNA-binding transcriptional regulator [Fimbriimonas ginsengisoli]AIE84449.1 transcriptional regulator, LacI family [Fimbriimonas ginsengisoli Gsoil 348]